MRALVEEIAMQAGGQMLPDDYAKEEWRETLSRGYRERGEWRKATGRNTPKAPEGQSETLFEP